MSLNHLLAFQQVQLHREPKRQFLFPEVVPEGGFCPHLLGKLGAFSQARRLTEVGRLRQARRGGWKRILPSLTKRPAKGKNSTPFCPTRAPREWMLHLKSLHFHRWGTHTLGCPQWRLSRYGIRIRATSREIWRLIPLSTQRPLERKMWEKILVPVHFSGSGAGRGGPKSKGRSAGRGVQAGKVEWPANSSLAGIAPFTRREIA